MSYLKPAAKISSLRTHEACVHAACCSFCIRTNATYAAFDERTSYQCCAEVYRDALMLVKGYSKADLALLPPSASCHLIGLPERQLRQDVIMQTGLCLRLHTQTSWAIRSVPGGKLISSGELPMMDFIPSAGMWATAMRNHQTVARISQVVHNSCICHSVVLDKREHTLVTQLKDHSWNYLKMRLSNTLLQGGAAVRKVVSKRFVWGCIIFTFS